ncbi:MAG: 1-deoxy-D-xylulose-5-phosphate reductoisomerase [Alphaproteobacteria bacterium]|nr:1-deoxy-D-xylulose-5-phosphate reductoisomerase [Alphaproteobacteria bacterium]
MNHTTHRTRLRVIVFGATGTVGRAALKVIDQSPDLFEVVGLACGRDAHALVALGNAYSNAILVCAADADETPDPTATPARGQTRGEVRRVQRGKASLEALARQQADVVVMAIAGVVALTPTLIALREGRPRVLAMANKEALVVGGEWLRRAAQGQTEIIPVDSEHNALYQILGGTQVDRHHVKRLILTSSGGPFLETPKHLWPTLTPAQACRHPNWNMGRKISVDSATMTNKALEVLEAATLFDMPLDSVEVIIHPEQYVHAMVECHDGNVLAHCAVPDMQVPLAHALHWLHGARPTLERLHVDWRQPMQWRFQPPDRARFPVLDFVRTLKTAFQRVAFNAANEAAVEAFLAERLRFDLIFPLVAATVRAAVAQTTEHEQGAREDVDDGVSSSSSSFDDWQMLDRFYEIDTISRRTFAQKLAAGGKQHLPLNQSDQ